MYLFDASTGGRDEEERQRWGEEVKIKRERKRWRRYGVETMKFVVRAIILVVWVVVGWTGFRSRRQTRFSAVLSLEEFCMQISTSVALLDCYGREVQSTFVYEVHE